MAILYYLFPVPHAMLCYRNPHQYQYHTLYCKTHGYIVQRLSQQDGRDTPPQIAALEIACMLLSKNVAILTISWEQDGFQCNKVGDSEAWVNRLGKGRR